MLSDLLELFEYDRWASERMLEAVAAVSDEQLNRELGGSFPTLRHTLVHLLSANWVWLRRWTGTSPTEFPRELDAPTLAALREAWTRVEEERREFLAALTPERLDEPIAYRNFAGESLRAPLRLLIRHVVNHATYHRGQVATLLRQLDARPLSTDLSLFYREKGHVA